MSGSIQINVLIHDARLKMLQITNLFGEFAAADTFGSGQAARHCCVIRRLFGEADLPNGTGVIEFVLMLGHRHHDKVDLLILDEGNDVGRPSCTRLTLRQGMPAA